MDIQTSPMSLCSFYVLIISFGLFFIPSLAIKSCNFPAIFIFGDSNSDTGALQAAFSLLNPPYGATYFQKPAGRWSDGRLIIDFIAESLYIPHVDAYLNSMGTNFTNGANFASGGATIGLLSSIMPNGFSNPFYLQVQFLQFLQFKLDSQLISAQGGVFAKLMPKEEYFAKGLYLFDIGQNDIGVGLLTGKSVEEVNASVPHIVDQYSATLEKIYNLGARSFWIHNVAPIGCMPYILINFPSEKDEAGCAKIYNQLAQSFNLKLNESIVQLRTKYPLATFVYVDIYSIKYSLFTSPQQHGFEDPHVACCGHGSVYNYSNTAPCGHNIVENGEEIMVNSCDDPSIRVVWDGIHFTESANKFVFNQIMSGAFSHPSIPLNMACPTLAYFGENLGDSVRPSAQCGLGRSFVESSVGLSM